VPHAPTILGIETHVITAVIDVEAALLRKTSRRANQEIREIDTCFGAVETDKPVSAD